jgi:hypothetical protein
LFTADPNGKLYLQITGTKSGGTGGRKGRLRFSIVVRTTNGIFIFETDESKNIDTNQYFETEQTFEIVDGYHQGNLVNQDASTSAEIEVDFFNCFAYENGVESYRIKDGYGTNSMSVDLRPCATTEEEFKQVRRTADITYGDAYIDGTEINGINVFNLSTANFKELDKSNGSIQKLYTRDNNVVVLQENKVGQVLFGKNALYTEDGSFSLSGTPNVLGTYIPYQSNRGIGTNPESFSVDDAGRIKYASVKNGVIVRLSADGVTDIVYGMEKYFREELQGKEAAKILSCYDPYRKETVFSIGDKPAQLPLYNCSNEIQKYKQSEPFVYELLLNNLGGDIVFTYNITEGQATIIVDFDGTETVVSNASGTGTVTVPRTSLVLNRPVITIVPTTDYVSYSILNSCPVGTELSIITVVLNDDTDTGKTIVNRFKSDSSSFIEYNDLFTAAPLTRFDEYIGIEGVGAAPLNGGLVTMQSFKSAVNDGQFLTSECNKMAYLVSDANYGQTQWQDILNDPDTVYLTTTESGEALYDLVNSASFIFSRSSTNQKLYLIWDYTNRAPILTNDTANVNLGGSVSINVLGNDEVGSGVELTIQTNPVHGSVVVNMDGTITYTHDGTNNFEDSFQYKVTDNGCSSIATVNLFIGISCGNSFTASGSTGIYEVTINLGTDTGWAGIEYNAQSIPDRFQIIYDGSIVADSKYVGDSISPGPPTSYSGLLGDKTLMLYQFNGTGFESTGTTQNITIVQEDIANNTTEPTDGNGILLFNKTTSVPATMTLRVTGPVGSTAWGLTNIICPTPDADLIAGTEVILWGFYTEANKALQTKSIKAWRGVSPDKFYTSKVGGNNFSIYNNFASAPLIKYVNDGVSWFELDATGNIISTGTL